MRKSVKFSGIDKSFRRIMGKIYIASFYYKTTMINEIIEYVKDNPFESGFYAMVSAYGSYVISLLVCKSKHEHAKDGLEDRLTEEKIFSRE